MQSMGSNRGSFVPTEFIEVTPARRRALASAVESLIAFLDALDPDPDLEESADAEPGGDREPTMGAPEGLAGQSAYEWARGSPDDECEQENEHGGDIQDEPHDGELDLCE